MRIEAEILRHVTLQILLAAGVDNAQAAAVSENLTWCDMIGRRNHGVERLPILLKHVAAGTINCPPDPNYQSISETMQRIDADQSFGHFAGRLATDTACDLAEQHGVGIVGVTNSNFFGAGAYYADRAAQRNMISLVLSNSFPKVAAPGGLKAVLGTNPFTFGAPRRSGHSLLVDMSTAAVAGSTVREKIAKGEQFETGVAIDDTGHAITNPADVMGGTLLPAAGAKGFGLALLVEIFSAVLTGAAVSHEVGSMYKDFERSGENGHFVLAIDVARWMPLEAFFERIDFLASIVSDSGPEGVVRLPGAARWKNYDESLDKGIEIEAHALASLEALAQTYAVKMPWSNANLK